MSKYERHYQIKEHVRLCRHETTMVLIYHKKMVKHDVPVAPGSK
jgi:hypothetical protein